MPCGELVRAVAAWVHRRLVHTSGSSRPLDTAADTAFLTTLGRVTRFDGMTVTATTAGGLPAPDDTPFPLPRPVDQSTGRQVDQSPSRQVSSSRSQISLIVG